MKICTSCNETKELTEFYNRSKKQGGLRSVCKKCNNLQGKEWVNKNKERYKARSNLYRRNNQHVPRKNSLGVYWPELSGEERLKKYDQMFKNQNGLCAICNRPETKKHKSGTRYSLSVDHNHTTKVVRELLCTACNHSLGFLKENISFAENLINYLRKHNK